MHTTDRNAVLTLLIAFEAGDLSNADTLRLFSRLVKSGLAWTLQGSYGRMAHRLIADGWLSDDGTVNPVLASSLCEVGGCHISESHHHAPPCSARPLGWRSGVKP